MRFEDQIPALGALVAGELRIASAFGRGSQLATALAKA